MGTVALTPDTASYLDRVEQPLQPAEPFEWLNLEGLTVPAALVERGLSEVEGIQGCGLEQTRKAAVVGTDMLGLLATLVLRLRGAEVVTLGLVPQGLLSPNRVKGIAGWKHVWMSPALAQTELVEETGAQYANTSELTLEGAARSLGPFDVIMVGSADSSPMPSLARGLAEHGVLVGLTRGDSTMEIWTASPTPISLVKHRVTLRADEDDRVHSERAARNLALAEALYPGWLARLLESFAGARRCASPLSAYVES